jgi:N-acetylneuraminate lyase
MSQFDQLTIDERKALADVYVPSLKANKVYSILHVGHQTIAYAKELAKYAEEVAKPDAIAVMPPFAPEKPASVEELVDILAIIAAEAPSLPFFYYHIPGITGLDFAMADM